MFEGLPLQTEQLGTLPGYMVRLLRPLRCFTANEQGFVELFFEVPLGWVTDLTSLPEWLPLSKEGPWTPASVAHDYLYGNGTLYTYPRLPLPLVSEFSPTKELFSEAKEVYVTREFADQTYHQMMLSLGASKAAAWVRYRGVRLGGWIGWRKARRVQHENRTENA